MSCLTLGIPPPKTTCLQLVTRQFVPVFVAKNHGQQPAIHQGVPMFTQHLTIYPYILWQFHIAMEAMPHVQLIHP